MNFDTAYDQAIWDQMTPIFVMESECGTTSYSYGPAAEAEAVASAQRFADLGLGKSTVQPMEDEEAFKFLEDCGLINRPL